MSSSVPKLKAFDEFTSEYDEWFDSHPFAYQSEVEAIRRFVPDKGLGVEIGVGTGRFSVPFSIIIGVEPSEAMAAIARSRGITTHIANAEHLPFESERFDFAMLITTLCFLDDPKAALREVHRILKPNGRIIVAIIDKETELGRTYESMKASNKFYGEATFYSTQRVLDLLHQTGFIQSQTCQTIFSNPESMTALDPIRNGYGEGAFVVIHSNKQYKETK